MKTIEMTSKIYDMLLSNDIEMSTYAKQVLSSAEVIYVNKDGEKRVLPIREEDELEGTVFFWLLKIDYRVATKTGIWNDRIINDLGEIVMKDDKGRTKT